MAIGLATLPLDRFIGWQATKEGTLTTKPLRLDGSQLDVNIKAPQGEMKVEVLDAMGKPISGYAREESIGAKSIDSLRFAARWKNHSDLAKLKGQLIQLRFVLRHAKMFAFQVK